MNTKRFHLGDVLSIIVDRIVSPTHAWGLINLLSFLTGRDVMRYQIPQLIIECRPHLLKQFPQFNTPEMNSAGNELDFILSSKAGEQGMREVAAGWLSKQIERYGETLDVTPISTSAH